MPATADLMTWSAASRVLNRSIPWVKGKAASGELKTVEASGRVWLDRASVDELRGSGGQRRAIRRGAMP